MSTRVLSVAAYRGLLSANSVPSIDDTVLIGGSGLELQSLTVSEISHFTDFHIDGVSTEYAIPWNLSQAVAFAGTPTGLLSDLTVTCTRQQVHDLTPGAFAALSLKMRVSLVPEPAATPLTLNADQFERLGNVRIVDAIHLVETAGRLLVMPVATFFDMESRPLMVIDVTDNDGLLPLTLARALRFAASGARLNDTDRVTVVDSGGRLTNLTVSEVAALRDKGFVGLDGGTEPWNLTAEKFNALGLMGLGGGADVSIYDDGTNIAGLDFQALRDKGIDNLTARDGKLALSKAQLAALGSLTLTVGETLSLADADAAFADLPMAALVTRGFDVIDVTDGHALTLSKAQAVDYSKSAMTMATGDRITIIDTADAIGALTAAELRTFHDRSIAAIDLRSNRGRAGDFQLGWDIDQAKAFSDDAITMAAGDSVRVYGNADAFRLYAPADLRKLADATTFILDGSESAWTLDADQVAAFGATGYAEADDTVTLAAGASRLSGLSAPQLAALTRQGIDSLRVSDNDGLLALRIAQALAF
ncbi:MAG: hypothetical protein ABW026_12320, partial [Microvirga sp.]